MPFGSVDQDIQESRALDQRNRLGSLLKNYRCKMNLDNFSTDPFSPQDRSPDAARKTPDFCQRGKAKMIYRKRRNPPFVCLNFWKTQELLKEPGHLGQVIVP